MRPGTAFTVVGLALGIGASTLALRAGQPPGQATAANAPVHDYPVKPVPFTAVHLDRCASGRRASRPTAT